MGKPIVVLCSVAAFAGFAATNASATPIAPPVAPMSGVEQVRLICNEWGRCWRQPDYYRPYGYYRRYGDDDWRYRRYREGYGYYGRRYEGGDGGWRRGWGRDDDLARGPPKQPPQGNERARRFRGPFSGAVSARPRCARRPPRGVCGGGFRNTEGPRVNRMS